MSYRVTLDDPARVALINLRARAAGRAALESALGFALPAPGGLAAGDASRLLFGLGPDEWLLKIPLTQEDEWLTRLEEALAPCFASVLLVSDAYRVLRISGPETIDVLAQATGVDLDPRAFPTRRATRAAFAKVSAILHRVDDRPTFEIYVDSALARYAFRWLEAASGRGAATS